MKFIKALICFLTVACLLEQIMCQVKLLAFGDVGQIDPWVKQNIRLKIASKIKKASQQFIEKYSLDVAEKMLQEKLNPSDDVKAQELFKNFAEIYTCKIDPKGWDRTVILGDGVYTEQKGGHLKATFGKTYTADETILPLKEIVKQKRKVYMVGGNNTFKDLSPVYDKRIGYASKKLYDLFQKSDKKGEECKNAELEVLPGNHSFDVDAKLETQANSQAGKNPSNVLRWKFPTWSNEITSSGTKVNVNFLDLNLMTMICLDEAFKVNATNEEEIYKNCILHSTNKGSNYLFSIAEAKTYLLKLIAKLIQSKIYGETLDWRIIRTHGPLMNPEVDLNSLLFMKVKVKCYDLERKMEKFDLNNVWLNKKFTKGSFITCELDITAPEVSLLEIFRKSEIDFWLASHYHAAMVVATPFQRLMNPSTYQSKFINLDKPGYCIDRFEEFFPKVDKLAEVKHPGPSDMTKLTKCVDDAVEKVIELLPKGPQNLFVEFIIGHSGRFLDPIKSDALSNGDVVWARAKADKYMDSYVDGDTAKVSAEEVATQELFNAKVNEIADDAFKNYKNRFGYAFLTIEKNQVMVEYRETGLHTVVKKFKVIRRTDNNTVHKIERMLTKPRGAVIITTTTPPANTTTPPIKSPKGFMKKK